jgi:hypothetical protein
MSFPNLFACRSILGTMPALLFSLISAREPAPMPGAFVLPVALFPSGSQHGDMRPSQVPELSLCIHALLSDPGGVLPLRLLPVRTAAFRAIKSVGFPSCFIGSYPSDHDQIISGFNTTACILATPGSIRPLTRTHAGLLPTCRLGFDRLGLATFPPLTHWTTLTYFVPLSWDS